MRPVLYKALRLIHPITLAVILVGVAGFLAGLIAAVERQDAAVAARERVAAGQTAPIEDARLSQLQAALAERDAELGERRALVDELRAEVAALKSDTSAQTALAEANSRISSLEAALADSSAEQQALHDEVIGLSGQLADAIQTRDELRDENAQLRRESDARRAALERTVAGLRRELEALRTRTDAAAPAAEEPQTAAAPEPVDAGPQPAPESTAPADTGGTTTDQPAAQPSEPRDEQQAAARPSEGGPIAQGIAAYRAAEYGKAYELWLPPALAGSARAQFFVGALYFEGRGVAVDRVKSYLWLRAATRADDPGADRLLDRVRQAMTGPELAEAETRIANGETIPDR